MTRFGGLLLSYALLAHASLLWSAEALVKEPPAELKAAGVLQKVHRRRAATRSSPREQVNDYALKEAAFLVEQDAGEAARCARGDDRERFAAVHHRRNEFTTDLPEFAAAASAAGLAEIGDKDYWDARARGTGGSADRSVLLVRRGEPARLSGRSVFHRVHPHPRVRPQHPPARPGATSIPTFDARLKERYDAAMKAGLWKGKYASVNHHEYFAEGVQSWFDNNRENDHDHNHVNTRAELLEYDPGLAELCREVFGDTELVYTKPATRLTGHLAGYDPAKAPTFVWPERLQKAKAEIRRQAENRK